MKLRNTSPKTHNISSMRRFLLFLLLLLDFLLLQFARAAFLTPGCNICGALVASHTTPPTLSARPFRHATTTSHTRRGWPQRPTPTILTTTTTLGLVAIGNAAVTEWSRAALSLGVAAAAGFTIGGQQSILATLATAALLSNAGWAPVASPLYEASWRYFLPGSLVLLLLSLPQQEASSCVEVDDNDDASNETATSTLVSSARQSTSSRFALIRQMALPFALASLASLVGCLVSLALSTRYHILPTHQGAAQAAPVALSCLLASFIGGSINFMATSRLIVKNSGSNAASLSSLLSAMAAADLLVMAVYFGLLGVAVTSPRLRQWVVGNKKKNMQYNNNVQSKDNDMTQESLEKGSTETNSLTRQNIGFLSSLRRRLQGSLVALTITWVLVEFAHQCEKALARIVPGTACGVLAIVTPLVQRLVPAQALGTASFWSELAFLTLFASIGLTAHMGSALRAGPGCLILSMIALLVHVVIVLLGTAAWNRLLPSSRTIIDLDTALIASNAAIGGPATAATWAGRTAPRWALAATVWGVVGYATGTTIGVWFYQVVGQWIR